MTLGKIRHRDGSISHKQGKQLNRYLNAIINPHLAQPLKDTVYAMHRSHLDCVIYENTVIISPQVSSHYKFTKGFSVYPDIRDADGRMAPFFSYGEGFAVTTAGTPHLVVAYYGAHDPGSPLDITKDVSHQVNARKLFRRVQKNAEDAYLQSPHGGRGGIHATNLHFYSTNRVIRTI